MLPKTNALVRLGRVFGISDECESSLEECLSSVHREYIIDRVRQEEEREQACVDELLADR